MNIFQPGTLPPELGAMVTTRSLMVDQTLFHQGGTTADGFLLMGGRLKLVRYIDENHSFTLGMVKPGEWVAPWALFETQHRCSAIATKPTQVQVYPKFSLLPTLRTHGALAIAVMEQLAVQLHTLSFQHGLRDVRAAHDRLRYYLVNLSPPEITGSTVIELEYPFKDIAADLGLTPETLSRALSRLESMGNITRSRNVITLYSSFPTAAG
ncbi:MAG: Crp/Fnr family transcriptional regulator [Cyanobacteria bacterium P01_H01_bin.119]